MNKIYKVIWNATLGTWVAVSEITKGKTKSSTTNKTASVVGAAVIGLMVTFSPDAMAAWTNSSTGGAGNTTGNYTTGTSSSGISIGSGTATRASAEGDNSIAIGSNAIASAVATVNQGVLDRKLNDGSLIPYAMNSGSVVATSIAIGAQSNVDSGGGIALGAYNVVKTTVGTTSGTSGYAIGLGNSVTGSYGTALGTGNKAAGISSTSIGTANQANGNTAIALGRQSYAEGDYSIAQGNLANASANNAIAIGSQTKASGQANISLGVGASSGAIASGTADGIPLNGGGQIAIGKNAYTSTAGSIAIGNDTKTGDNNNFGLAIGGYAEATGNSAVAMGRRSQALAQNSTAIGGRITKATAGGATAIGSAAEASGVEASALGAGLGTDTSTNKTVASGNQSLAVGTGSSASNTYSTAIGGATSSQESAIAIGRGAQASNLNAVAMGAYAAATGDGALALGGNATAGAKATNTDAIAIGGQSVASGVSSIAQGLNAQALGAHANAFGRNSVAAGNNALTLGGWSTDGTTITYAGLNGGAAYNGSLAARYATSIGSTNALLSGSTVGIGNRITIGNNNPISTLADLNDGALTKAYGASSSSHAVGIGDNLKINGGSRYAVAIGADIIVNQNSPDSFAFGRAAEIGTTTQTAEGGVAIGAVSKAQNTKATAIGSGNLATGAYSTAIGSGGTTTAKTTQATADGALALGGNATAGAQAISTDSIAIGGQSVAGATGKNQAIAIGKGAQAIGTQSISVGTGNIVKSNNAGVFGDPTTLEVGADGTYVVGNNNGTVDASGSGIMGNSNTITTGLKITDTRIIGNSNIVSSSKVMVLGNKVNVGANLTGAVVLGDSSAVKAATAVPNSTVGGNILSDGTTGTNINYGVTNTAIGTQNYAAGNASGGRVVSVGGVGTERQIQNVAAGRVTVDSTDAINGSQLYVAQQVISNLATSTAKLFGGDAEVDPSTGEILAPVYSLTDNPHLGSTVTAQNVGDALKTLNTAVNQPLTITGTSGSSEQKLGSTLSIIGDTKNVSTEVTTGQVKISISDTPTFNSVTVNNAPTAGTDATNKNYVDSKISGAKTQVVAGKNTSVSKATGATATDPDIYTVNADSSSVTSTTGALTVTAGTKDANGNTAYDVDLSTSTKTDLQKGVDAKTEVDKGLSFAGDTGTTFNRKLGQTTKVVGGATGALTDNNIGVVSNGTDTLTVQLAKDLVGLNSVESTTVKVGDATNSTTLTSTTDGLDVGGDKITNVGAGTIAAGSTDVVTGDQLNNAANDLTTILGGNATNVGGNVTTNDIGGTGEDNINDAIQNVNTAATKAKTTVTEGLNTTVTSSTNGDGSTNYKVETLKDVNFDSVTVGNVVTDSTTNKISGLTDGTVAAGSTEAITGNQLNTTADSVGDIIGGGVTNNAGNVAGPFVANGNSYSTIADAITAEAKAATTTVTEGLNITVTSSTNTDGSTNYEVATAKDVNFDSVTVGKGTDTTTLTSTANGLDVGGDKITNVGAGTIAAGSTDAVTGDQLNKAADNFTTVLGGNATNVGGNVTTNDIGGTGKNTIDDAISTVNSNAAKAKTEVVAGKNISVTSAVGKDGQSIYTVETAKDVSFDQVTVGPVTVSKAGINAGNTQIKNVAEGTAGTDAVTVSQLKNTVNNEVNNLTKIIGTVDGPTNPLFETYNVAGQNTTDRRNIFETVQNINTKGAKYFHTNAVDESVEAGVIGATNDSSAGGKNSTAVGVNAIVADSADSGVALGHDTAVAANATHSLALGSGSTAGGASTIAIGHGAQALGNQSISIGTGNIVKGNNSGALGDPSIIDGNNSYSVGNNNTVATDNTFVLGNDVTQTVEGSVVLGNKSAATTGAGVAGYTLAQANQADRDAITATTSSTGAVAVGDAANGVFRQVTGVAVGTADSDAVNVAQLKAVDHQVTTTQQALVDGLGGDSKVNTDGTITGPTYNVGGGKQTNVGDALDALNKAVNTVDGTANAGWTVKAGDQSQSIKPKATVEFAGDKNITVAQTSDKDGNAKLTVALNKNLDVEQLKAGDTVINTGGVSIGQNVQLGGTGLVIKNGPSVTTAGIDAGNKVITNVAAGQKNSDAVNKGQLDSAITNINNNVDQVKNNAVQYDKNADGTVNKGSVTLGGGDKGTTLTNVADGKVVHGSKDAVNGGQLADVRDNLQGQITNNTNDISNIKNEINNGSLGIVKQPDPKGEITVGQATGGTSVNMAGKDGDRTVTGVKDGAISATSKDAVNGSQLNTTNNAVAQYLGGGASYNNITQSFDAPSYTVGDTKHNNVGGAIDALNKADKDLGDRITNVSNNLEQAFNSTNARIDDVEKRANAGIAAAMALETAPYVPGKYTYAAAAAHHGGENAVGVTLRKTADNGRWSLTGGIAAASEGDPSFRIGISGVID